MVDLNPRDERRAPCISKATEPGSGRRRPDLSSPPSLAAAPTSPDVFPYRWTTAPWNPPKQHRKSCHSYSSKGKCQCFHEFPIFLSRRCSCSLGRVGPGTTQAEFLNYCLTPSGHLRPLVRLHCLVISTCWKSFNFSVHFTEGKSFSLLPLVKKKKNTEKRGTHLQNWSWREISQPPPSFSTLFLNHSLVL